MRKYIGFIGAVIINCILITVLITYAFTLSSVKDNGINDSEKEYIYIEKTTVKEEKEIDTEKIEKQEEQENNNKDYVIKDKKINTTKKIITNSSNSSNSNSSNSNSSNSNNSEYIVNYTNNCYCGFCGKQLNNNDGICEECRTSRSKLGE